METKMTTETAAATPFTVTTTKGKRPGFQVRMEGRLIATYPADSFTGDHWAALTRALSSRYAGDEGKITFIARAAGTSRFTVVTPS
jgi:hypothetical protein